MIREKGPRENPNERIALGPVVRASKCRQIGDGTIPIRISMRIIKITKRSNRTHSIVSITNDVRATCAALSDVDNRSNPKGFYAHSSMLSHVGMFNIPTCEILWIAAGKLGMLNIPK